MKEGRRELTRNVPGGSERKPLGADLARRSRVMMVKRERAHAEVGSLAVEPERRKRVRREPRGRAAERELIMLRVGGEDRHQGGVETSHGGGSMAAATRAAQGSGRPYSEVGAGWSRRRLALREIAPQSRVQPSRTCVAQRREVAQRMRHSGCRQE